MCRPAGCSIRTAQRSICSPLSASHHTYCAGLMTAVRAAYCPSHTVRAFIPKPRTNMPSADFSHAVRADRSALSQFQSHATSQGTWEISRGKTQSFPRVNAGFIKHAPVADGGLRGHVPTRPGRTTPPIRFLFVVPRFRIGLPSDPTSRRRPCPSPSLRLGENLAWGLSPHQSCAMPGTHVEISRAGFASAEVSG